MLSFFASLIVLSTDSPPHPVPATPVRSISSYSVNAVTVIRYYTLSKLQRTHWFILYSKESLFTILIILIL